MLVDCEVNDTGCFVDDMDAGQWGSLLFLSSFSTSCKAEKSIARLGLRVRRLSGQNGVNSFRNIVKDSWSNRIRLLARSNLEIRSVVSP